MIVVPSSRRRKRRVIVLRDDNNDVCEMAHIATIVASTTHTGAVSWDNCGTAHIAAIVADAVSDIVASTTCSSGKH